MQKRQPTSRTPRRVMMPIAAALVLAAAVPSCTTGGDPVRPEDYQISTSAPQPYPGPGIACSRVPPPRFC